MSGGAQLRLWLAVLGAALVVSSASRPIRKGGRQDIDLEHWQLLGDKKLIRIARRFVGGIPERPSLAEWNRDGIRLDVRIAPSVLESMWRDGNREFYKERYVESELRFGDGPPLSAMIALRGSSALNSPDELSFKVKLARKEQIAPDFKARRFYLMALVEDPRKVKVRWAAQLHAELGLFPMYHQFVDIHLNGERQGLGMLIEPPSRAFRRVAPNTTSIYRRKNTPKIYLHEWDDGTHAAEASMRALRVLNEEADLADPIAEYEGVIDVDSYLEFLSASSILLNGDTGGELWLYQTCAPDGTPRPLRFSAWDLEDVTYATKGEMKGVDDPLMYWAEGFLEQQVARYPALHARYRATLARLLDGELSFERIRAALHAVQAQVDTLDPGKAKSRARYVARMLERLRVRNASLRAELANQR